MLPQVQRGLRDIFIWLRAVISKKLNELQMAQVKVPRSDKVFQGKFIEIVYNDDFSENLMI